MIYDAKSHLIGIFSPVIGILKVWIFFRSIQCVWLVVWLTSVVAINSGGTISDVRGNSSSVWTVDWDLLIVLSESISVGVWVREESSLKHLAVGWLDAWNEVAW